ncbi:MAG TPA: chorismate mutase, partial [Mariniflexile sp.]|nr:chorismate mutase [Mariniflexile sp.]
KTNYRNNPEWQLVIEFQNKYPDIPLINDPSHITGNRNMIFDLSQTALDLNFDGLMIETHFDPDNAWSDASQQVTPETLIQIMRDLKIRKETDSEVNYNKQLENLRAQIDVIDNQIIELLGKRMKAADGIGELKKSKNVSVLQSKRWNEILGKMVMEGESKGLSEEFILKMFKAIHQESINHQERIING